MSAIGIYGATGIGKTTLAREAGYSIIRNINDLGQLGTKEGRSIILSEKKIAFDDFSWRFREPEELIHLGDQHTGIHCTLRILNSVVTLLNCHILVLHNDREAFEPWLATAEQQRAINRRWNIRECLTTEDLLRNVPVRIQIRVRTTMAQSQGLSPKNPLGYL